MPLAHLRPTGDAAHAAVLTALKSLARRVRALAAEHDELTATLDDVVTEHNPGLRAAYGIGPDTAAQLLITAGGNPDRLRTEASFAALCRVAPVLASSGKTNRHRLSRGGDRAVNAALYRIALVRMAGDGHTRDYVVRQTTAGRTKKEIMHPMQNPVDHLPVIPPLATTTVADRQERPQPFPLGIRQITPPTVRMGCTHLAARSCQS
ncbi:transposase [Streptomyces sp. NPDC088246]|uniref:transposase n=1 Tax=Streptomyces sp. NPDC088246 TaxID=3365842 RepID=UPI00382F4DBE